MQYTVSKSRRCRPSSTVLQILAVLTTSMWLLPACDRSAPAIDTEVLATVGGDNVTRRDLEQVMEKMIGANAGSASREIEEKALESLVRMRAIAVRQEQAMSPDQRETLEARVSRYRDELLVEAYLREHAEPKVPSEEDIRRYYEGNLDRFGGGATRFYEVLQADGQSPQVLKALSAAGSKPDWHAYAAEMKQHGLSVSYGRGGTEGPGLPARLVQVLAGMSEDDVSDVLYVNKKPQVVRVIGVRSGEPAPLNDVRGEIRRILATRYMRDAIGDVAAEVLQSVEIKYARDDAGDE